jgi:hypothetical protein
MFRMFGLMLRGIRRMSKDVLGLQVGFCTTFRAKCAETTVRESITEYLRAMDVPDSSR